MTDRGLAPPTAKPINLALQGGGAHGAFSWGVLDKLLEDGRLAIEGLSGTSAGSMNAVVYAYGKMTGGAEGARQLLEDFWREVSLAGYLWNPIRTAPWERWWTGSWNIDRAPSYLAFSAMTGAFSPYDLNPFDFNPLRDALAKLVRFEDLPRCRSTKLFLSATDVRTGRVAVFRNADVTLDAVMASAALPMLYKAVEIGECAFWDGGYVGNPSLWPFFYETGTDDLLILHVNPLDRPEIPTSAPEIANRVNEVTFNSSLIAELRAIQFVQKLLREGWIKDEFRGRLRDIRVHAIRTDEALADLSVASKFNPDWDFLCELRDRGRAAAGAWLSSAYESVGERETVDIRTAYLAEPKRSTG